MRPWWNIQHKTRQHRQLSDDSCSLCLALRACHLGCKQCLGGLCRAGLDAQVHDTEGHQVEAVMVSLLAS